MPRLQKLFELANNTQNIETKKNFANFCFGVEFGARIATVALAIFATFTLFSASTAALPTALSLALLSGVCFETAIIARNVRNLYEPLGSNDVFGINNVISQAFATALPEAFAKEVFKGTMVADFLFRNLLANALEDSR